jgi:hypothetical protein
MTEFKIEVLNGKIFVIQFEPVPTSFQDVKHGPYKNEKSAKERIRKLRQREAEKIEATAHCETPNERDAREAEAELNSDLIAAAMHCELPSDAVDQGEPPHPVFDQPYRPRGVYPAVGKNIYRRRWNRQDTL